MFRVFESLLDAVLIIDDQRRILFGNTAAGLLLDVSARRLSSKKPLESILELEPSLIPSGVSLADIDEPLPYREISFNATSGKSGWVQTSIQKWSYQASLEDSQTSACWVIYLRDVTLEKTLHEKYRAELDKKEKVIEELSKAKVQLSDYSKNLERMVEARTSELRQANTLIKSILDSLGQGIFVFDRFGQCLPFYSRISESLFGTAPGGQNVVDVMRLDEEEKESFQIWRESTFEDSIPFIDLVALGPQQLLGPEGQRLSLTYFPLKLNSDQLTGVILVATDRTAEVRAREEAERERSIAKQIMLGAQHRNQFRAFLSFATQTLRQMSQECSGSQSPNFKKDRLDQWSRDLHTLKGGAATFSFSDLALKIHHAEDALIGVSKNQMSWTEFTSEVERARAIVDDWVKFHQGWLGKIETEGQLIDERTVEVSSRRLESWVRQIAHQANLSGLSQEIIESCLLLPADELWVGLESHLMDLAHQLGKKLKPLKFSGHEIRVRPELFRDLFNQMIHVFRNAVDHGLETPQERIEQGKDEAGQIQIQFYRESQGAHTDFVVEVRDDGRGVDIDKLRERLLSQGRSDVMNWSEAQVLESIFESGVSTGNQVSMISGRGVGLSALKAAVEKMHGQIEIQTQRGRGSCFRIRVNDESYQIDDGSKEKFSRAS